jgi:peptide chain release factor 1
LIGKNVMADMYEGFLRRLEELSHRYDELTEAMNDPVNATNPVRLIELSKEHGKLGRLVKPFRAYKKVVRHLEENREIARDASQEAEMRALAREEIPELEQQRDRLITELQETFVVGDEADIGSVIMEIRAGTGGDEAALFARDLYGMYARYCERNGLKVEVLDSSPSELGGFKEIILSIKGPQVYRKLGYESGGHRVQRVPETEAQGRIHTSAATVAVLPEPEEVDVKIDWDKDVEEFVSRAGGPGGQNVNKVSSAIRLHHLETGITVSMRDEKSQHKNRAKARRLLISRVYDYHVGRQRSERAAERKTLIGSGDRSQRIRTYNFPQNRCTDHRIGMDLYSLDKVIAGEMDELIRALQDYDKEQRLKNL